MFGTKVNLNDYFEAWTFTVRCEVTCCSIGVQCLYSSLGQTLGAAEDRMPTAVSLLRLKTEAV